MERAVKIMLVFSVACWGLIGFMSNMLDYTHGVGQVRHVLSMEGAADTPGVEWRRVTVPAFATLGFAFIWASKLATGLLCLYASLRMLALRNADAAAFDAAKRPGIIGCGIAIVMLFLGFIVIAENFFEYWRVPVLGLVTHDFAFSYIMCMTGFLLILNRPEKEYNK